MDQRSTQRRRSSAPKVPPYKNKRFMAILVAILTFGAFVTVTQVSNAADRRRFRPPATQQQCPPDTGQQGDDQQGGDGKGDDKGDQGDDQQGGDQAGGDQAGGDQAGGDQAGGDQGGGDQGDKGDDQGDDQGDQGDQQGDDGKDDQAGDDGKDDSKNGTYSGNSTKRWPWWRSNNTKANDCKPGDGGGQQGGGQQGGGQQGGGQQGGGQQGGGQQGGGQDPAPLDVLGTDCKASKLKAHKGLQDGNLCVNVSHGDVPENTKGPSLLITGIFINGSNKRLVPGRDRIAIPSGVPFDIEISSRNLVRDRFLAAAQGGYYAESSFLDGQGLVRGHVHTSCRGLPKGDNVAPDSLAQDPEFFEATEDKKGGSSPDKVRISVKEFQQNKGFKGEMQCSVWAGDGSHRIPMMQRARQQPAFDSLRLTIT